MCKFRGWKSPASISHTSDHFLVFICYSQPPHTEKKPGLLGKMTLNQYREPGSCCSTIQTSSTWEAEAGGFLQV